MKVFLRRIAIIVTIFLIVLPLAGEVTIDASALGGIKARMIGPAVMSGRISAIESPANNTRIIYVGTAGGGVWKSDNGGTNFTQVFAKHTMSIGCIAIDPKDQETVWVGTGECNVRNSVSVGTGLYRTTDGGKNWKFMGFADSERISEIAIDPSDSNKIYIGVMGHLWNSNEERGVFKSIDGGKKWEKILYVDKDTGCADLGIDPQEPDVLYASMWKFRRKPYFFSSGGKQSGLYKTVDGGKNWKKLTKGLPKGELGRIAFAIAPSRPGTLYATVEAEENGLYRSDEMGENWKKVNETLWVTMRPFYFSHLVVDPMDHEKLYITGLLIGVSEDGGENVMPRGNVHSDVHAVWVNPNNPENIMAGTDGGVFISWDRGMSFSKVGSLPVSQFYHVSYDMEFPYNVYGGLQDNGSWYGPSRTYSGPGIQNKHWKNVGIGDGFNVFRHPKDKDLVYHQWQGGRLTRYNERTNEVKDIQPLPSKKGEPDYRFNWNAGISLSPTNDDLIYIGSQFLFKSHNRGDTWIKISPDLTTNDPKKQQQHKSGGLTIDNTTAENHCTIFAISQSPLDDQVIWVGTDDGNLQLTKDGGKTWQNLVKNIPGLPQSTWCSSVKAGNHKKGTAYATFDGHRTGDMKPYVYKTEDFGKTWTSLVDKAIEGYCHIILEDPVNPKLLFLGSEFGLSISIDGGTHWAFLKEAMPRVSIRDMVIHPREHDLIMATHGLGIQIIDDLTPLRALTTEVLEQNAVVLPSRLILQKNPALLQGFPGDAEFIGSNPPEGAEINYYLKKRHIFGDLKIEVIDSKGNVVKTLPTSKRRGINKVHWAMRLKPPKIPSYPGLPRFFSAGPMAAEGSYTIRLVKVKKHYDGQIKIAADPIAGHSDADRKLQYETVIKLYDLQEDLAFIIDNAVLIKDTIDKNLAKTSKQSTKAKLKAFRKKIDDFHKTLAQHEGIMAGDQLLEKVAGLYSSVIQYGGKPSDSQLFNYSLLKEEVKKRETIYKKLVKVNIPGLNKILKSNKLTLIKPLTREEFKKKK